MVDKLTVLVFAAAVSFFARGAGAGQPALWAAITVQQPVVEQDRPEDKVIVCFAMVNDGDQTVDPRIGVSRFFVNGVEAPQWHWTINNGPRDSMWRALPPGRAVRLAYDLGSYFPKAGVYTLRWEGPAFRTKEVVFRVMPKVVPR